jgi:hypothetical protein
MGIHQAKTLGFALLLGGLALCGSGLWLLLSRAQYQAVTKLRIDPYPKPSEPHAYDEDFIPLEIEVIESEAVLGKVVRNLNLKEEWGKKHYGGHKLETGQTVKLLKKRIKVQSISHTLDIEIRVTSKDPDETAKIANTIAGVYLEFRMEQWRKLVAQEIQTLTDQYQKQEEQIHVLQTNVDLLRTEFRINKEDESDFDNPNITLSKVMTPAEREERQKEYQRTKPFWDEKRKLNPLLDFHKLLAAKIEAEKSTLQTRKSVQNEIKIVERATPSQIPAGPNHVLGVLLCVIGLFTSVRGFLLFKPSRRQSA